MITADGRVIIVRKLINDIGPRLPAVLFFFLLQGTLKGFDQTVNLILSSSHERVFSSGAGVEVVQLGLYIIRGDNMYGQCFVCRRASGIGPFLQGRDIFTHVWHLNSSLKTVAVYTEFLQVPL